jgi:hypothetical protein
VCSEDVSLQKGPLVELYGAVKTLVEDLKIRL